jgi:hypothetical protein
MHVQQDKPVFKRAVDYLQIAPLINPTGKLNFGAWQESADRRNLEDFCASHARISGAWIFKASDLLLRVSGNVPGKRDCRTLCAVVFLRCVVHAYLGKVQDDVFSQAVLGQAAAAGNA